MATNFIDEIKEINSKLDIVLSWFKEKRSEPGKIRFADFCREKEITRMTAYNWEKRGRILIERKDGKCHVIIDSIPPPKKYQRNKGND